eukprot:4656268-Amphidinium_carterae.2
MGEKELQRGEVLETEETQETETKDPTGSVRAAEAQRVSEIRVETKEAGTGKTSRLVDPEDVNEVNHWLDEDDEYQEPYEVAAVKPKDLKVTFSLPPQIFTREVENIIIGRTGLLKKKSRARVGTKLPTKTDSRESVREARHRAKAMRAEVISEEESNDEYGAFSVQPRRWLMDTGSAFDLADEVLDTRPQAYAAETTYSQHSEWLVRGVEEIKGGCETTWNKHHSDCA